MIVDCTDAPRIRYLLNDAAVAAGKPLVAASSVASHGSKEGGGVHGGTGCDTIPATLLLLLLLGWLLLLSIVIATLLLLIRTCQGNGDAFDRVPGMMVKKLAMTRMTMALVMVVMMMSI